MFRLRLQRRRRPLTARRVRTPPPLPRSSVRRATAAPQRIIRALTVLRAVTLLPAVRRALLRHRQVVQHLRAVRAAVPIALLHHRLRAVRVAAVTALLHHHRHHHLAVHLQVAAVAAVAPEEGKI